MPEHSPRQSPKQRLGLLALDVLDEAFTQARLDPIERTALHRLALGYLLLTGWANAAQVKTLWAVLGHEGLYAQMSCRQSHFGSMSHHIRRGIESRGVRE